MHDTNQYINLTVYICDPVRRHLLVVGFITTSAISDYHHLRCEFKPRMGECYSIQQYVTKFVSDLRHVSSFLRVLLVSSTNSTHRMI